MTTPLRPTFAAISPGRWCGLLLVAAVALGPWWRNHDHLCDLYDYGLFINVNARLAEGQRPYVDFSTPAQSATFLLNYGAERAGGGTYLGMTWGAAGLIVAGVFALGLMLARRWPPLLATLVAGAVVIGSGSQHTIIFYNPVGVLALALVVWSFAIAPVLRRQDCGWHVLAAGGLVLGGLNKLNFHLLACVMAVGWVLFAWIVREAGGRRVAASLLFIAAFGLVVPVAVELGWSGAGWHLWYHNVAELPLQARGSAISMLASSRLYLTTLHDFYGTLHLPPVGLLGIAMPMMAVVAIWRTAPDGPVVGRRVFAGLAGLFVALATLALLLSNNEIAYLTMAAAIVMTAGLWLGFGLRPGGGWFFATVLLPAILLGVTGWESAWVGQRSQFGHSREPRDSYVRGETAGPEFGYLRGLLLPPSTVHSLTDVSRRRQEIDGESRARIFYGLGAEWLEHIWPVRNVPGMALVATAFAGPRELALFRNSVLHGETYGYLLVAEAWDHWDEAVSRELAHRFQKERVGSAYFIYRKLPDDVLWARPLEYMPGIGGNVDSTLLKSAMTEIRLADGRRFLGTNGGPGRLEVGALSNRASGEAVIKRVASGSKANVPVHFEVFAVSAQGRYSRWRRDAVLPEDKDEMVISTDRIDASGMNLAFDVRVPDQLAGSVAAGWRAPTLWDTVDRAGHPPLLQAGAAPLNPAGDELRTAVLPKELADSAVYVRNAWLQDGLGRLPPGGEIWIPLNGIFSRIVVTARIAGENGASGDCSLRVVYYKGGRLERFQPTPGGPTGSVSFVAWSAENDGWLGLLAAPYSAAPMIAVRVESAQRP